METNPGQVTFFNRVVTDLGDVVNILGSIFALATVLFRNRIYVALTSWGWTCRHRRDYTRDGQTVKRWSVFEADFVIFHDYDHGLTRTVGTAVVRHIFGPET